MDRVRIKEYAKAALQGNYGVAILAIVIQTVAISIAAGPTLGIALLLLAPPFEVGLSFVFLSLWRRRPVGNTGIFHGFQNYLSSLLGILWRDLWVFLWSLLFLIPGILKAYEYFLVPYLLADYPEMRPNTALKVSGAVTQGHRMEIFIMQISFFWWSLLSAFTGGILYIFYVGPYMNTSLAGLYDELMLDAMERGVIEGEFWRE